MLNSEVSRTNGYKACNRTATASTANAVATSRITRVPAESRRHVSTMTSARMHNPIAFDRDVDDCRPRVIAELLQRPIVVGRTVGAGLLEGGQHHRSAGRA